MEEPSTVDVSSVSASLTPSSTSDIIEWCIDGGGGDRNDASLDCELTDDVRERGNESGRTESDDCGVRKSRRDPVGVASGVVFAEVFPLIGVLPSSYNIIIQSEKHSLITSRSL